MVEALTLTRLHEEVRERYAHDEQCVVGIMMARYDLGVTKVIVEQNYQYWHLNTRQFFDVFLAGYGAYLPPSDESLTKTILKFPGNTQRAYFDLDAFIEIKDQFNEYFSSPYENYAKIRKIMEFVTNECRSEYEVAPIAKKLKLGKLKDTFKGITLSDVINAAIGIAGLTV